MKEPSERAREMFAVPQTSTQKYPDVVPAEVLYFDSRG